MKQYGKFGNTKHTYFKKTKQETQDKKEQDKKEQVNVRLDS